MKKLVACIIMLSFVIVSCQNNASTSQKSKEEVVTIAFKDFNDQAGDFVGKKIQLIGTADHVCKHGGQKMFLVSEDSEDRIKVVPGENVAAFNTELEGESIVVIGMVDELRVDEEYLNDWEKEVESMEATKENDAMHMGEGSAQSTEGSYEEEQSGEKAQINKLREQLMESEKGYLSFFSIKCVDYKVVSEKDNQPEV